MEGGGEVLLLTGWTSDSWRVSYLSSSGPGSSSSYNKERYKLSQPRSSHWVNILMSLGPLMKTIDKSNQLNTPFNIKLTQKIILHLIKIPPDNSTQNEQSSRILPILWKETFSCPEGPHTAFLRSLSESDMLPWHRAKGLGIFQKGPQPMLQI